MDILLSEFNDTIITIVLLLSAVITLFLGAYIYVKSQMRPVIVWFLLIFLAMLVWNLSYLFKQTAPSVTISWVVFVFEMVTYIMIGPICYFFARAYRGLSQVKSWMSLVIVVFSGLLVIGIISDPLHHYFFEEYSLTQVVKGPLFLSIRIFTWFCVALAAYHYYRSFYQPSVYRKQQAWYIGSASVIPIVVDGVQASGLVVVDMQLSLMVLPFSLILIGIAVLKYQFLDILPYSLTDVVDTIDDGFLVLSLAGNIEDYNKRFFEQFLDIEHCRTLEDFLLALKKVVENRVALNNIRYSINVKNDNYVSGEMTVTVGEKPLTLHYTTKAINDLYGVKIATIITFHDISEIQNLYQTLASKKNELISARERLESHIETVQLLTVETERNKLMTEVHDTLGHTMAEVLAMLEKCDVALNEEGIEQDKAEAIISEASERARESLAEIRAAVTRFKKMGVEG